MTRISGPAALALPPASSVIACLWSTRSSRGSRNASVLPEPVCVWISVSSPFRMRGRAWVCARVAVEMPSFFFRFSRSTGDLMPRSSNVAARPAGAAAVSSSSVSVSVSVSAPSLASARPAMSIWPSLSSDRILGSESSICSTSSSRSCCSLSAFSSALAWALALAASFAFRFFFAEGASSFFGSGAGFRRKNPPASPASPVAPPLGRTAVSPSCFWSRASASFSLR
mmetsp:Transcript_44488/g.139537  ORF Transcript_44488/g.139537 Transcript_44488/m.139537 type:complete len:227 (+) Transcript_44488:1141-1821(+)